MIYCLTKPMLLRLITAALLIPVLVASIWAGGIFFTLLIGLTAVIATSEFNNAYPERWGATVRVTSSKGDVITAVRKDCKGDPQSCLTPKEIETKAKMVMSNAEESHDPENLIKQILMLSELDTMPAFPLSS